MSNQQPDSLVKYDIPILVSTSVATFFVMMGVALVVAGIASMMAPDGSKDTERPENKPSYIFNGAVNTYRQGNPIPVGFGILQVGSQVISAAIKNVDVGAASDSFELEFIEGVGSGADLQIDSPIPEKPVKHDPYTYRQRMFARKAALDQRKKDRRERADRDGEYDPRGN